MQDDLDLEQTLIMFLSAFYVKLRLKIRNLVRCAPVLLKINASQQETVVNKGMRKIRLKVAMLG